MSQLTTEHAKRSISETIAINIPGILPHTVTSHCTAPNVYSSPAFLIGDRLDWLELYTAAARAMECPGFAIFSAIAPRSPVCPYLEEQGTWIMLWVGMSEACSTNLAIAVDRLLAKKRVEREGEKTILGIIWSED